MNLKIAGRVIMICLTGSIASAIFAAVDAPYEVGTWANFCQGAVSHTFDDYPNQVPKQLTDGQQAFNDKGFHMTIFVQTGSNGIDWNALSTAFKNGHEIASHSVNHGNPMGDNESKTSQDAIKKNVPGELCATIAYPNCKLPSGGQTYKQCYIAGRTCSSDNPNTKTPGDFYGIQSKIIGAGNNDMNGLADKAISQNGWGVYLHHGIDGGHGYANTPLSAIKDNLDYLDKNRSKVWCETFGNIARYIKERDAASVTKKDSTDKGITISVTDNLPDSIFNYPLSIRRPLPDGWTKAVVTQKGAAVDDTVVTVSSKQYVMFKAVPDGGDVVISSGLTAIRHEALQFINGSVKVQLVNNTLQLAANGYSGADLSVRIFSLKGQALAAGRLTGNKGSFILPADKITRSPLIVEINESGVLHTMKFIPQL